ncbi:MAG: tRNA (adenosine(37)-N6)-threonylcarbamoyltransferase complex transferase subunit TsaD [Candidatus Paceibacterota bacterium]
MNILAIETSCDDTAIAVVTGPDYWPGNNRLPAFRIEANLISSQNAIHAAWGGVVPSLAKREHGRNITPLLDQVLIAAKLKNSGQTTINQEQRQKITTLLSRESDLAETLINYLETVPRPKIDALAVTFGPGLEPALWTGINFAQALSIVWQLPVLPINHLEGHIVSALTPNQMINWPALALIVSGGHTELVLVKNWFDYEIIGQTRDDAAGEAFDKVARLLGLPYPGGPEISRLAGGGQIGSYQLPRPMLRSDDYDFSFSGLKTAVRQVVGDQSLTDQQKADLAREFETAVIDVLVAKTFRAIDHYGIKTLIVGGGVIANQSLRQTLAVEAQKHDLPLLLPPTGQTTDNAAMIGLAGLLRRAAGQKDRAEEIIAVGNANLH